MTPLVYSDIERHKSGEPGPRGVTTPGSPVSDAGGKGLSPAPAARVGSEGS